MCLAIPGKIENIDDGTAIFRTGKVNFAGIIKTVNLACTPEARIGDYVLVHAGLAISVIDKEEASKTLSCIDEIDGIETRETPR